jgi:hypothetical protein
MLAVKDKLFSGSEFKAEHKILSILKGLSYEIDFENVDKN